MDTLQCAVVLAKLDRFEWEVEQRQRAAACYDDLLGGILEPVGCRPDRTSVYAQYTVLVPQRERLQAALHAAGIPTAVHYPVPIDQQPAYAQWASPGGCPVAASLAHEVLSLPMGPYLDRSSAHRVVQALAQAIAQVGGKAA
jgi:UDP-2-acetamido-2-deoxy-ribo-hexuluronate aminotransferase